MRLLLALAALLFLGCDNSSPFHGDVAFAPEERAAIERGAAFINDHLTDTNIRIVWDGPKEYGSILRRDRLVKDGEDLAGYSGLSSTSAVVLVPEKAARGLDALAAHEFGHWKGMAHVAESGPNLMSLYSSGLVWSDLDQSECERVGACD